MEFDFTAEELGGLAAAQTEALLQALLIASGIHREFSAEDSQRFAAAVARLPLAPGAQALQAIQKSAVARYNASAPADFVGWLGEIAAQLPEARLREKTLVAMGHVAWEDMHEAEPGALGTAIDAFALAADRLALIKEHFPVAAASPSSTVASA